MKKMLDTLPAMIGSIYAAQTFAPSGRRDPSVPHQRYRITPLIVLSSIDAGH